MKTNTWIKEVTTEHTGGECMVDLIHLKDGRILGINDECCVLYENIEQFYNAGPEEKPSIWFPPRKTTVLVHQTVKMEYEIEVEGEVNKESVAKIMEEVGYPDASSMKTEKTWFYKEVPGSAGGGVRKIEL